MNQPDNLPIEAVRDEPAKDQPASATESKGCEGETPLTNARTFDPYPWNQNGPGRSHCPEVMYPCDDGEWVKLDDFRDLERKLNEARTALESVRSDCQCAIDQYNQNGPQWTSRESGAEYYDASYMIESANERIATIDEALARIDAGNETSDGAAGCGPNSP